MYYTLYTGKLYHVQYKCKQINTNKFFSLLQEFLFVYTKSGILLFSTVSVVPG